MAQRRLLFILLSLAIFFGYSYIAHKFFPAPNNAKASIEDLAATAKKVAVMAVGKAEADAKNDAKPEDKDKLSVEGLAATAEKAALVAGGKAAEKSAQQWVALGSVSPDPKNKYRMLVTLTSQGAAIERVEMSSDRYLDLEDRHGYLGNLAATDSPNGNGCLVNVVGAGTPAAAAGLQPGDIITEITPEKSAPLSVANAKRLEENLDKTEPEQKLEIKIKRNGVPQTLTAALMRRPLAVIRPEYETHPVKVVEGGKHDPFSMLLTLQQLGDKTLGEDDEEIQGVHLRTGDWKIARKNESMVEFETTIPNRDLKIVKRYTLAEALGKPNEPAYDLLMDIEISYSGEKPLSVAYQLDGPNGLPTEGAWYARRIQRDGVGLRDFAFHYEGGDPVSYAASMIVDKKLPTPKWNDPRINYVGVEGQYFAAVLMPTDDETINSLAEVQPTLAGAVPADAKDKQFANVSFRLTGHVETLKAGPPLRHHYKLFVGPKQPKLLAQYVAGDTNLGELVYYGWPIWGAVAKVMTDVLHFFYGIVGNYGLAIIMLTVLVRGCMFPLSRKQAVSAQKMQLLKPEMDAINLKYKGKAEDRTRAMQELWRKHNYNPMGGCLLVFLQLPIFMGLYRALMIDIELRQAPLISKSVQWCSNLAAPDMFWNWESAIPVPWLTGPHGWLGPYLNILPLITVALFIWQQKMFMPPATDDNTRMQQKLMKYMMIVIGVMFFGVASGLCLYFISSSLWGIAERKLLPKTMKSSGGGSGVVVNATSKSVTSSSGSNGSAASRRKKQRGKN